MEALPYTYSPNCHKGKQVHLQKNNNKDKNVEVVQYKGETRKNGFESGNKYLEKKDSEESVLWLHSLHQQARKTSHYSHWHVQGASGKRNYGESLDK